MAQSSHSGVNLAGADPVGALSIGADLAHVVNALGTSSFSKALHAYLSKGVSAKLLFAYAIRPGEEGVVHLLTETISARMRSRAKEAARTYAKSDFRKDRTITELRSAGRPGLTIRLQHAADFEEDWFRERYFDRLGMAEEISLIDGDGPDMLYVGVCTDHFDEGEQNFVRQNAALMLALLRKHRELVDASAASSERPTEFEQMQTMLMEHPCGLTAREAEICVLVARGYTSEAIGLNLVISPHTVATHRKKAYAKLRVSSQAELFAQLYVPTSAVIGLVG